MAFTRSNIVLLLLFCVYIINRNNCHVDTLAIWVVTLHQGPVSVGWGRGGGGGAGTHSRERAAQR